MQIFKRKIIKKFEINGEIYGLGDNGKIYVYFKEDEDWESLTVSGVVISIPELKKIVDNFEPLIPFI